VGGTSRSGVPILDAGSLAKVLPGLDARIGVIAVPACEAQRTAAAMVAAGLRALLNFAPATVGPFPGATVKNADLTLFLETLAFQLAASGSAAPGSSLVGVGSPAHGDKT
jgi:redox-sensing transcriptional repressor